MKTTLVPETAPAFLLIDANGASLGRVAAKAIVENRGEVTLDLTAVNQRDEVTAAGQATLVLPRRSA